MRAALGCIRFSPNSGLLMLNAHHAAVPSCDLLNVYDFKSSSVSERIIMGNVTCNPLLLHSAGHVIDFQKKKGDCTDCAGEEQREAALDCSQILGYESVWLHLGSF